MRRSLLVVDDNPADTRLVREAFGPDSGVDLHEAGDATEALAFLERRACDLVLLDLNLPGANGHELLADIRARDAFRSLPVVVFSTSDAPEDIRRAYEGGANCFVTKPGQLDAFLETLRQVERYWFDTARLP